MNSSQINDNIVYFKNNFISVPIEPCESMEELEDDDNGEDYSVDYIDNVEQSSVDYSMDVSDVQHNDNRAQSSVNCPMGDVSDVQHSVNGKQSSVRTGN